MAKKIIITIASVFGVILAGFLLLMIFLDTDEGEKEKKGKSKTAMATLADGSDYSQSMLTVDRETGDLTVSRPVQAGGEEIKKDGIWTIFVYLCGSDLESQYGAATNDMVEMMEASASDKVRFVVQTGGASEWNNEAVNKKKLQRFVVQNEDIELVDEVKEASMAKSNTLAKFLKWGVNNYSSEHMGVILWNHGGGSIGGICYDETDNMKSLSLRDVDSALLSAYSKMSGKFEFVGFDACLMGSMEAANVLASYANYMYASEESEPGCGWDYTSIGNFLAQNPSTNGLELGKEVCDSFKKGCEKIGDGDIVTLSVIDLSQMDSLLQAFNTFAKNMYETSADTSVLSSICRKIEKADNFGGNNKSEGYTNMVDLGGLVTGCRSYAEGADAVSSQLEKVVAYKVSGKNHKKSSGLSVYYPLCIQESDELSTFSTVCVSPYYLSFVDRQDCGSCNEGNTDSYDEDYWWSGGDSCGWYDSCSSADNASDDALSAAIGDNSSSDEEEIWCWFCDYEYDEEDECYRSNTKKNEHWNYVDDYKETGESKKITFASEPAVDSDGIFGFTLDDNGLKNTEDVSAQIYEVTENGKEALELGETYDVDVDWDKGQIKDYFDGYWLSLPDGQNLATYIVSVDDNEVVYTSPILLNGEETNLRMIQDKDGKVVVEGAWDGIDENGAAAKNIIKLKKGDIVTPCYTSFSLEDENSEEKEWEGEGYELRKASLEINYDLLAAGDYMYSFRIDDVFHDYLLTDYVTLRVDKNGKTSIYDE